MKILVLVPGSHPSPQRLAAERFVRHLIGLGHQVNMVSCPARRNIKCSLWRIPLTMCGVVVRHIRLLGGCLAFRSPGQIELLQSVDETLYVAAIVRWYLRCPQVHYMLCADQREPPHESRLARLVLRARRWSERHALAGTLGVLVSTESQEEQLECDLSHVPIVQVDPLAWHVNSGTLPEGPNVPDAASGSPRVVYWGEYSRDDDLRLLFDAVNYLVTAHPALQLVLLGATTSDQTRWKLAVHVRQLQSRVTWLTSGPDQDVIPAVLRAADILVAPRCSGSEPAHNFLAYLAAARPIVATRVPPHTCPAFGDVAWLVDPNAVDFYLGLQRVLLDTRLRHRMTQRCIRYVREETACEIARDKVEVFYDTICTPHS